MDRRTILLVVAVLVAAMGAGLVFVYVQGAEDRAAAKVSNQMRLVAIKTILPGESASDAADAGKLLSSPVPEGQVLEGSTNDGGDLEDTIALTTIYPGEQLVTQKFGTIAEIEGRPTLPIPAGKTAVTLKLSDTGRVSSFTQPGSRVAVYFAPDPAALQPDRAAAEDDADLVPVLPACVIEEDLLVLGVGSQSVDQQDAVAGEEGSADSAEQVALMTVAVDPEQASTLVGFQIAAEREDKVLLAFALRNDESDVRNTRVCAAYLEGLDAVMEMSGPAGLDNVNG